MNWFATLVICVGAYLAGSLPFGLWITWRHKGVDVRNYGSGGTGMTNVSRVGGTGAAAIVLLLDLAKGALPVLAAQKLGASIIVQSLAGLFTVVGHSWPILAHFRGGKGAATALGALLVLVPIGALCAVIGAAITLVITRIMSLGSIVGTLSALAYVLVMMFYGGHLAILAFVFLADSIIILRHVPNIRRLMWGQEPRLG